MRCLNCSSLIDEYRPRFRGVDVFVYINTLLVISFFSGFSSSAKAQDWIVTEVAELPVKVSNNAVCEGFIGETPYLFSFGGIDSTKLYSGIHLKSYRFNTLTNEAESIPDLPDNLGKIAAGASRIDSIIYIVGGYHVLSNGSEISSAKVHRYNIQSNTFLTDAASIPIAIDDHVQAVWRDSLIYVVTGWSNTTNRPDVQIYDPNNNTWQVGTSTPNNNTYKSFGASGSIIGDTIYYFGGASLSGAFNIQNQLRRGVINPEDPTEISWTSSVPDAQVKGYRMASTKVFDQIHWIGGSAVTYNFNGIAYNGTGGVPPINRDVYINTPQADSWNESTANDFPMDLRGIASISDTLKFLAGGMLSGQEVTNKIYKLMWDNTTAAENIVEGEKETLRLYPNPIVTDENLSIEWDKQGSDLYEVEIFDAAGKRVFYKKTANISIRIPTSGLAEGIYFVKIIDGIKIYTEKLLVF